MESPEKQEQPQHIRPKVRSTRGSSQEAAPAQAANGGDLDRLLESTRQRIQSRLVVSSENDDICNKKSPHQQNETNVAQQQPKTLVMPGQPPSHPNENTDKPKSILKVPKYSSEKKNVLESEAMITSETDSKRKPVADKPRAAVKDTVMERENPVAQPYPGEPDAHSVEGYTPKLGATTTQQQQQQQDDDAPLVFSSISELMSKAGTLPQSNDGAEPQVVEADLSFACMTSQEYDETLKCASMEDDPEAKENVPKDNVRSDQEDSEWDDDEDSLLGGDASDMSEEEEAPPQPRAFMKLWEVLTDWATPETVALLKQWRDVDSMECDDSLPPPQVDKSDVGSSRRKGLKSMIRMYLSPTIIDEDQRRVEFRLDNLLRTFNYSSAMAKFDSKMWKAVTCVLVDMVLIDSSTSGEAQVTALPAAARDVGMVAEEYRYLTRSAMTNLESQS